jgi:hypothetical protein
MDYILDVNVMCSNLGKNKHPRWLVTCLTTGGPVGLSNTEIDK